MAFTCIEVEEAREAVNAKTEAADLFRLGLIYSTDHEDHGPDFVEAHKWFSLAAMLGSQPAKAYCSELTCEMSKADLTLSQRAARGWMLENRETIARKKAEMAA